MAAPKKPTKINLKVQLKNTSLKDLMPDNWDKEENPVNKDELLTKLQAAIEEAGLVLERVTDAPLKLKATCGADVYKLIGLLQQPVKAEPVGNQEVKRDG